MRLWGEPSQGIPVRLVGVGAGIPIMLNDTHCRIRVRVSASSLYFVHWYVHECVDCGIPGTPYVCA